ncbi:MAG: AI-2E family transporter [Lactobacillales bacterium]|jgi:predicted PurR-regulated permease PerM|nr:AI-2E family transporter [Lactobacillales bacterium]
MNEIKNSKLFYWTIEALALCALVFLFAKIDFIIKPIGILIGTVFLPLLIAGFFYYMLNPLVDLLEKIKVKRIFGTIIVFVLLLLAIVAAVWLLLPPLIKELSRFEETKSLIQGVYDYLMKLSNKSPFKELHITDQLKSLDTTVGQYLAGIAGNLLQSLGNVFQVAVSTFVILLTAPFVLFFMLKDGNKIDNYVMGLFDSNKVKDRIEKICTEMNDVLKAYISGQLIACLFVGFGCLIGFNLIGLNYAIFIALFCGMVNLIPYVGPFIGAVPIILICFDDPVKLVIALIILMAINQINGSFIYPNIAGKKMNLHPVTVILVLLVAGNIGGFIGFFIGIPVYAVAKILIVNALQIYKEQKKGNNNV